MSQLKSFIIKLLVDLRKIHLVDKCLLVFMLVLLLQSAYSLFVQEHLSQEAGSIDVIVRTSTAAIFGYFLSANFMNRSIGSGSRTNTDKKALVSDKGSTDSIKNQMGFAVPDSEDELVQGAAEQVTLEEDKDGGGELTSQLQIVIATAIGLFCLLILIFMRNVMGGDMVLGSTSSSTATVAQFRDFISGCVGFLIGCPTSGSRR